MYKKECKWCNELIEVEKQPLFALHVANCKLNPNLEDRKRKASLRFKGILKSERIKLEKVCPKCGDNFEILATESEIRRNKVKKFCSRKCGNSRNLTEEAKKKIGKSLIEGGKRFAPDNKGRKYERRNGILLTNKKNNEFTCLYCGEIGKSSKYKMDQKYHKACWLSISGGLKEGSSRGKSGWYKGYWCDSSYELAYLIYCLESGIEIERNKKGFEYVFENKKHLFYPDFIVEGKYVEIKNFESDLTDAKISYFPHEIKVYYKDTIQPYLKYVKDKYGKKFIYLYENGSLA
jgi:hypothetical protein